MHIVFATIEFVTEKMGDGGLANYLAKVSRIFADKGHKITVIVTSEKKGEFEYYRNVDVVRVLKNDLEISALLSLINDVEYKKILRDCWYSFKVNQKLNEINRKNKIDIVQYCHLNAIGLFRNRSIPGVVRMSAFDPIDREVHKSSFELKNCKAVVNLSDKMVFRAIKRADGVFAPSILTAKVLEKTIHRSCEVLETPTMGVDIKDLADLPENLKDKKYFLFFGTLNNKKGLKVIVQSIHRILQENPQYYFVMVGKDCGVSMRDGMRTPVVKKMREEAGEYQDRVLYFPAMFDRGMLNTIIYHAEFCLLPFRFENLPNTCVEAMEFGRIVISTYKSGISQLIKNGYSGFLVEQNNPDALAGKVKEVIEMSVEEKKRISKNAVRRTEKMKPDSFYDYMMAYYQKIITEHSNKKRLERGK